MNNDLMFSSISAEWETPQDLFNIIDSVCHFNTDVCATDENKKCDKYWTKKDNALQHIWVGVCWMNPPYGREISKFMQHAYNNSQRGDCVVVCLVPSRTDTAWWHDYALKGEVIYFRGRLKFINRSLPSYRADGNYKISSAPFPSALVVFDRNKIFGQIIRETLIAAEVRCA
jgi:phage N-6-adenine-methyltransferase